MILKFTLFQCSQVKDSPLSFWVVANDTAVDRRSNRKNLMIILLTRRGFFFHVLMVLIIIIFRFLNYLNFFLAITKQDLPNDRF